MYKKDVKSLLIHFEIENKRQAMNPRHDEDAELAILIYSYIVAQNRKKRQQQEAGRVEHRGRKRKDRTCWVRPWLSVDRRHQLGHYSQLLNTELRCEDIASVKLYYALLRSITVC